MHYSESHEWISIESEIGTVGITEHAKNELGEIVFIQLPKVGQELKSGDVACILESTKAAVDVYSPVSGTVVQINGALAETPEKIKAPSKDSWLFQIQILNPKELESLLSEEEYGKNT